MLQPRRVHGTPKISNDERIAREADCMDVDLRTSIVKLLLQRVLHSGGHRPPSNTSDPSPTDLTFLISCETDALSEFDAIALDPAPLRRLATLQRSFDSSELHAGAQVIAVREPDIMRPAELHGHLFCIPRHFEEASDASSDGCSSTTTMDGQRDYFIALANKHNDIELYGFGTIEIAPSGSGVSFSTELLREESVPAQREERIIPAASAASAASASSGASYYACLSGVEDDDDAGAGAAAGPESAPHLVLQEIDLHLLTVEEATELVQETINGLAAAAEHGSGTRYVVFVVGAGKHSDSGPKIKPAIRRLLHRRGLRHGFSKRNAGKQSNLSGLGVRGLGLRHGFSKRNAGKQSNLT
jgi:hypothetical protein